uniref:Wiskott-Aldrich syndrome protein family member n=1 Tax=Rhabditophanes sp. KR3021 TaxID=114890 RepID=A0AC35U0W4_9BILA
MPLVKRSISPVNISLHRIAPSVKRDELECVANGTIANLVRQLSSLSKQAEQIFSEFYHETVKIDHKTSGLIRRVNQVKEKINEYDYSAKEREPTMYHARKPFKSTNLVDQHTFNRQTLPPALLDLYNKCEEPPKLYLLDEFRDDGKLAMKFYSYPEYFFDLWKEQTLKECERLPKKKVLKGDSPHKRVKKPSPELSATNRHGEDFAMPIYDTYKAPKIIESRHRPTQFQSMVSGTTIRHNNLVAFPEEYHAPRALHARDNEPLPPPPSGMSQPYGQFNSIFTPSSQFLDNDSNSRVTPATGKHQSDSPNSLELGMQNFKFEESIQDEDEDNFPSPPPPISMMQCSIVGQVPTAPKIDLVPAAQNNVPMPPPPPPPLPVGGIKVSNSIPSTSFVPKATEESTGGKVHKMVSNEAPRQNLLDEIKAGHKLRKFQKGLLAEQEAAAFEGNNVADILKKRMRHVLGPESDSDSNESENDWSD